MAEVFKTPEISYTSRDYESILSDMIRTIPQFVPEWTDHNPSDYGIAILELCAYGFDVLHYYIDKQMLEGFLKTAKKRESVILLLNLIGYTLGSAIPASVDVTFTLADVQLFPVLIPKGTEVRTISDRNIAPVIFETSEDLTILPGSVVGTVSAIEGTTIDDEFLGPSEGTDLQRFEIPFDRVIDSSIKVFIDEGSGEIEWESVESLLLSEATDLHYYLELEGNPEHYFINFGDNIQGKIPSPGATIRVEVRVLTSGRGGVNGNVGSETITVVDGTFTAGGDPVTVTVINDLSASGGESPESIEEAKIKGPQSLKALNRAVTEEDYEILTRLYPGIALAKAFGVESFSNCCSVCIVIYPEGGGQSSSLLKEDLYNCLLTKKMIGTNIEIKDAIEKKIDIEGIVYIRDNFTQDQVSNCVDSSLDDFFEIKVGPIDIGRDITLSDIYPKIMECFDDGVSYVVIERLTIKPEAILNSWSGDTLFGYIRQKSEAISESWTVTFITPTTFNVRGSISGLQLNIGTVGIDYISDNEENITLKIIADPDIASPVPNNVGDTATFITTPILGTVDIPRDCIAIKGDFLFQYIGGTRKTKTRC